MSVSPDVLASALVDLEPGYEELFTRWSPMWNAVINKNGKETLQSYRKEFTVVTGGPGSVSGIDTGQEVIAGGLNQTGVRGNEIAPRMIYAFDVPGKMLDEANGKQDIARIIEAYPDLAMQDFHEFITKQFIMGEGTNGVGGFITLNGQKNYTPQGEVRNGVFEFLAPASQTNTVFGLTKNTVAGWYNQFGDITSFAANGRFTMRTVYDAARTQSSKLKGPVDLMFCDPLFYHNYEEDLDDMVRFVPAQSMQKGDPSITDAMDGQKFKGAIIYPEEKILPAGFTGVAADGVCYGINSSSWHMATQGRGGITENTGFFSTRGPIRMPTQDMWRYEIVLSMLMWCSNLRANFVISGGDTP